MKKLLASSLMALAFCTLSAQNDYTSYFTGNLTDAVTAPFGGSCLMGGATDNDNAIRWFLQRANGGDVLVLRASGQDGYNAYMFDQLGATINSVETIVFNNAQAATNEYVLQRIAQAEAIWFAGGDQINYINYWRGTAVATLINEGIQQRNIVVGGTSAGMAILGGAYFSAQNGTVTSSTALSNPYSPQMTVSNTPFLNIPYLNRVITDTHYDNPDRRGRHAAFIARAVTDYDATYYGIACDEFTAVTIDDNGIAQIYGTFPDYDDNAYFISPNCAVMNNTPENCSPGQPLSWNQGGQALKVYVVKGTPTGLYTFDLNSWTEGDGGDWEDWSVQSGTLASIAGDTPNCSPVSTTQAASNIGFHVFPNPTNSGKIQIVISSVSHETGTMRLLNAAGVFLRAWPVVGTRDNIDLSAYPKGVYFLEYSNGTQRVTRQVVVR